MIKSFLLTILMLFSPALSAQGLYPQIIVSGAERPVDIGSMISLKASLKETPKDFVSVKYNWFRVENDNIVAKDFEVSDDSTRLLSGTGKVKKDLNFIIIPIIELNDGKKETILVPQGGTRVVVKVDDLTPDPTPTPVKPNLPPGKFDFAQRVAEAVLKESSITPQNKVKLATDMYANFKAVKEQIENPNNTHPAFEALLNETAKGNNDAFLSIGVTDKKMPLRVDMDNMFRQSYSDGKLVNPDSMAVAWGEIMVGLDWVVKNIK